MDKVIICNDYHDYIYGDEKGFHCDGLIFSMVSPEDSETLQRIASKYNKDIKVFSNYYSEGDEDDSRANEEKAASEMKAKKIWVNNGKENIRILAGEIGTYSDKGYKPGKMKK